MSHLLAIDPGSKTSGWAIVRREHARVRYLTSGTCDSTPKAFHRLLFTLNNDVMKNSTKRWCTAFAVEAPEGFIHEPYRGPHLLATSEFVGVVATVADYIDMSIVRLTAAQVRKTLVGKANSPKRGVMDKLISDAVSANVIGWPATSNVHVRDAGALAVVANWQLVSRRVA